MHVPDPLIDVPFESKDQLTWFSFADLHLKANERWGGKNPETGVDYRTEDKISAVSTIVSDAIEHQVDMVVGIGDLFDTTTPPDWLVRMLVEALVPLIGADIPFFYVLGNHGTTFKGFGMQAIQTILDALGSKSFVIIDEPRLIHYGDVPIYMVPEVPPGEMVGVLAEAANTAKLLFAHLTVQDVVSNGFKLDGISHETFARFPLCHFGDIHQLQWGSNWSYCGSTRRGNFGELGHPKGYLEGRIGDGRAITTFYEIPDREFVKVVVTEEEVVYNPSTPDWNGAIVKVICKGTRAWFRSSEVQELITDIQGRGVLEIEVDPEFSDFAGRREDILDEDTSLEESLGIVLEKEGIPKGKQDRYLALGREFLKQPTI